MTAQTGYGNYQRQDIESKTSTASPKELVVMIYDRFLEELDRLEGHIEHKEYERKGESIKKCLDLLAGLDIFLDMENGGELSQNIHNLYGDIRLRLSDISFKNDGTGLEDVRRIMVPLRDGWAKLGSETDPE